MRVFLFSKKFLVPFFTIWIVYSAYTCWKLYSAYADDFTGKSIPLAIKLEWTGYTLISILMPTFLLAFLAATSFYSHQYLKKINKTYKPFGSFSFLLVFLVAVIGFIFFSYWQPGNLYKGRVLLSDIVFAKPGAVFERSDYMPDKNFRSMTLSELLQKKKDIRDGTTAYHGGA